MAESLVWAVKNGDLDALKSQAEASGFDVNAQVLQGRALIHIAADYGQADVITFLISKGAEVNCADKHGITPLLAAIWEGHETCVSLLLSKGADKSGKAPSGESYLDCAEKESIKQLLR
ncbi:myotrophin-like [Apostichopus japonicus]|uniref:myotrophin-like n=1 Tax=Stichopus japonicus TaxID=307972 RepID=UPI003AB75CB6